MWGGSRRAQQSSTYCCRRATGKQPACVWLRKRCCCVRPPSISGFIWPVPRKQSSQALHPHGGGLANALHGAELARRALLSARRRALQPLALRRRGGAGGPASACACQRLCIVSAVQEEGRHEGSPGTAGGAQGRAVPALPALPCARQRPPPAHLQRRLQLLRGVERRDGALRGQVGEAEEERARDALPRAVCDADVRPGLGGRLAAEGHPRLLVYHLGRGGVAGLQLGQGGRIGAGGAASLGSAAALACCPVHRQGAGSPEPPARRERCRPAGAAAGWGGSRRGRRPP